MSLQDERERLRKNRKKKKGSSQEPGTTTPKYALDVERLRLQNNRLDAKLKSQGAKTGKGGPSLLNRAFDVLSRGQYASAAAVQGALGKGGRSGVGGSLIDALTGAKKGLEGKRKVSYSQVLDEHGVENKWARGIGGFAGDVLLDPTTYVGNVVVKGVTKAAGAGRKASVAAKAIQRAEDAGDLARVADEARLSLRAERLKAGVKVTTKEVDKVAKEAVEDTKARIAALATRDMPDEVADKLQVKFAGKKIIESERALKALKYPFKKAAETQVGQDLANLFVNRTGPITEMLRRNNGQAISLFDEWADRPIIKGVDGKEYSWRTLPITKKESEQFIDAYESGHIKEFITQTGGFSSKGIDYEELADIVRKDNDSLATLDKLEGLMKEDTPLIDNYLYHKYNAPVEKQAGFKANRRRLASDVHKPGQERKIPTIREAKEAGLNPETDLRVIMMNRGAKTHSSTARKYIIDDAVEQFGIRGASKETIKAAKAQGHEFVRLKSHLTKGMSKDEAARSLQFLDDDVYVTKEIADYLVRAERIFQTPDEIKRYVQLFDNVTQRWKGAATVYNPGHHLRNLSTDVFLSFLDGVKDPRVYGQASKILWEPGSLAKSTKLRQTKHVFQNKDLINLFKDSGAAPSWMITEVDAGSRIFKGKISRGLHKVSQEREEYGRFAHWLHAFDEGMKGKSVKNLDEVKKAAYEAAQRVRKWHIDYTDLTPFERNVMKRIIPFYTWMRHSTPLMVEAALTKPGKVAAVPKSMSAIQQLMGVDPDEQLPQDLIPKWLRQAGGVEIGKLGGNPAFLTPSFFPGSETAQMFETDRVGLLNNLSGIMGNFAAQTNPLIRAPFELQTGKTMYGQMPIESTQDYLINQIPAARNLNYINSTKDDADKSDLYSRLLRYFGGIGVQEVTPNRMKGELRRQMDPKEALLESIKKSRTR